MKKALQSKKIAKLFLNGFGASDENRTRIYNIKNIEITIYNFFVLYFVLHFLKNTSKKIVNFPIDLFPFFTECVLIHIL